GISSSSRSKVLSIFTRIYVELFQNTPLLIQIFFVYYGLPMVGIVLDTYIIGIICVGLYHAAYIAEVIRSGIGSVAKGQMEAALWQGCSDWDSMLVILVPEAYRVMWHVLALHVVGLIKTASANAIISVADIVCAAASWCSTDLHYVAAFSLGASSALPTWC